MLGQVYELRFTPAGVRSWRKLPVEVRTRIAPHLDDLISNPRPDGVKKLKGFQNLYRIRSGEYRVIYEIDDASRKIFVTKVANRSEAY